MYRTVSIREREEKERKRRQEEALQEWDRFVKEEKDRVQ